MSSLPLEMVNKIIMLNRPTYAYIKDFEQLKKRKHTTLFTPAIISFYFDTNGSHRLYPLLRPSRVKKNISLYIGELQYALDLIEIFDDISNKKSGVEMWFNHKKREKQREKQGRVRV